MLATKGAFVEWVTKKNPARGTGFLSTQCRQGLDGNRCSGWIANDPGHNQSVDVSYFAQTPDGQRRKANNNRYAIATRSVFNSIC
jgi:hypothetical protein